MRIPMAFALLITSAVLGGCRTQDTVASTGAVPASVWKLDTRIDRITAAPVAGASVMTSNSIQTGELVPRPATLQLTCFENKPLVKIAFSFRMGSDRNTVLGYRFDDKPGRDNVESRVLFGNQIIVIEDKPTVAQFVGDLQDSRQLFVRVRSIKGGHTTADFRVDGGAAAAQAAFADCPLAPEPRRTS